MDTVRLRRYKLLFQALGIEPLTKFSNLWLSFHCGLAVLQLISILIFRTDIFYTFDFIGESVDALKLILGFSCYFAVFFSTWRQKVCFQQISQHTKRLDLILEQMHINPVSVRERRVRIFKIKFGLLVSALLLEVSQEILFKSEEDQSMRILLAFTFSYTLLLMKHIQSIFYIDQLNGYFQALNAYLEQLQELIKCNEKELQSEAYRHFLVGKVKTCRSFYATLSSISELNRRIMGSFVFLFEIHLHFNILFSLYWTIFRYYNQPLIGSTCELRVLLLLTFF
jgi:hypothetical protein